MTILLLRRKEGSRMLMYSIDMSGKLHLSRDNSSPCYSLWIQQVVVDGLWQQEAESYNERAAFKKLVKDANLQNVDDGRASREGGVRSRGMPVAQWKYCRRSTTTVIHAYSSPHNYIGPVLQNFGLVGFVVMMLTIKNNGRLLNVLTMEYPKSAGHLRAGAQVSNEQAPHRHPVPLIIK